MKSAPRKSSRQIVQSAETGGEILKALARFGPSMSLSQVAAAADMAPAKAHRYLKAMIGGGLASQDPVTARYQLGPEAVAIGLAALGRMDAVGTITQLLPGLRDEIGHTCFVAVWGNRGCTVVRVLEAIGEVTIVTRVGSVLPLLTSATGLVFAAFLDPVEARAMDAPEAAEFLRQLEDPASKLAARLAAIKSEGVSVVHGALLPGIDAIAVPVLNAESRIAAVITTLGPNTAFDAAPDGRIARHLMALGQAASAALGAPKPSILPAASTPVPKSGRRSPRKAAS